MAFSGIPKFSQYILLRTSGDESIASIAREENLSKRDVAYIGQQFELRDDDIRYKYDENKSSIYTTINAILLIKYS